MKRNLLLSTVFYTAFLTNIYAQESVDAKPYSDLIQISDYEPSLPEVVLPAMDLTSIQEEDILRDKNGEFYRIGVTRSVNLNLNNSGVWSVLPNGDKIWRIKITSEGAEALALFYNEFYLPEGARLHVYTPDKSFMIGAFTSMNNPVDGYYSTDNTFNSSCIVEYFEPASQSGKGKLSIEEVGHVYRSSHPENSMVNQLRIDESDACEVDVACSPENTGWTDQIKSVVRIRVKVGSSFGWCTGTVVNNSALDCTPYVLSAWHCGDGATAANFSQWSIYFNYQKSGCGTGTAPTNNAMTGATMRANSNDGGGTNGSDFLLFEMNVNIPSNYNPYFSGWDRTTYSSPVSTDGVGIHHPSGDCKKISTYNGNVSSTLWQGSTPGTHWKFVWAQTTNGHGVTEPGSSGSGIFRLDNGLLWGTLTGGGSFCTQTNGQDYYGKVSFHWTSNGTTTAEQLKPWLDPTNSNVNTLTGTYYPCANDVEEHALSNLVSVYPNPSTGILNLSISDNNIEDLSITVHNMIGEVVYTGKVYSGVENFSINLSDEANGVYLVTVISSEQSISKKVIIEK